MGMKSCPRIAPIKLSAEAVSMNADTLWSERLEASVLVHEAFSGLSYLPASVEILQF